MSIYDEDEPYRSMQTGDVRCEEISDHAFEVTALKETGFHSGRRRFRVFCATCKTEIHEATTGPRQNISYHLREATP